MGKKKQIETQVVEPGVVAVAEAPPEPKKKRAAKKQIDAPAEAQSVEPEVVAAPEPKKKRPKADATLERVFAGYLDGLEKEGKSDGTIASYRMELALAGAELGIDTKVAELTPERVLLFFGAARVTKKRNGKAKSQLSIDKTRRVLRQALVWAENARLVAKAPLPELAASH